MLHCPSEWHPAVRHVLHVLCFHLDFKDGTGFPSQSRIAEMTGHDRSTVSRALSRAEKDGFIEKAWAQGKRSRRYQAVIPPYAMKELETKGRDVSQIPESMEGDRSPHTRDLRPHMPMTSGHTNKSMNKSLTPHSTGKAASNPAEEEGAETSIPVSRSLRELSKKMQPEHCQEMGDLLGRGIESDEGAMFFALGQLPLAEIKRFGQALGVEVETVIKTSKRV